MVFYLINVAHADLNRSHLTISVCIDFSKGSQGEADTVLRAGETHISKKRRDHHGLICGVRAEKEGM